MSELVEQGRITQMSVSQAEKADHAQFGGCMRRWWFETPQGLKPEQSYEKNEGTAGHELLKHYFLTGESPKGRVLMGKAVTGAILKGDLPKPGPDLIVESRFSGQAQRDASGGWIPLDPFDTLQLGGVPWDGAIDLAFRRGDRPTIIDHKFSSDPDLYAKQPSELIRTIQMPVYVLSQVPYWPDAREWEIAHHYVSKKGVHSFFRRAVVTLDEVREREAYVVDLVARMQAVAGAVDQNDVPANSSPTAGACEAWTGCPHQSLCTAFRTRNTHPRSNTMATMTEAERALFDSIPVDGAPAAAPAVDNDAAELAELDGEEAPPDDAEVARLQAQLEAAKAKATSNKRRMLIVDVAADSTATPGAVPPPVAAPKVESGGMCACGTEITRENGSKLQDQTWKHIGCKLTAPPPPPKPEPKARKPRETPASAPTSTAAVEQPKLVETKPVSAPVADSAPLTPLEQVVAHGGALGREALAQLFENLAVLVRNVA